MKKRFVSLIFISIFTFILTGCSANIDITKDKDLLDTTLILDNSTIGATEEDFKLFEVNGFDATIEDDNIIIHTEINYSNFNNDSKQKISYLKQIIAEINPDLKEEIDKIDISATREFIGYSFSGVNNLNISSTGLEDKEITINGTFDDKVSIAGKTFNENESFELKQTNPNFSIELLDNNNVKSATVKTTVSDKISSEIMLYFNEPINKKTAEETIQRNRVSDYEISDTFISLTMDYTSPEMFSMLHSADLYNMFGGIYMITMEDSNLYTQEGNIAINVIDNSSIKDVEYVVFLGEKETETGLIKLEEGQTYSFDYSETKWGSIGITIAVVVSITIVIGAFIIISKRKR